MRRLAATVTIAALLAGCATTGAGGAPQTAMQRAVGRCMITVGLGAVLGAAIGNNTGSGNAGRGAVRGALAGGALCAVMMAMANAEDRARVAAVEAEALEKDEMVTAHYVGSDGRERVIESRSYAVPAPTLIATATAGDSTTPAAATTTEARVCRATQTQLTVVDVGSTQVSDIVCRNPVTLAWEVQPQTS